MPRSDEIFAPVSASKTADEVVAQVESLLLDGVLRSGEKLPGERELALKLGVSRPVLRDALKVLEERGLIESRHGGGTYIADMIGEVFSRPLTELITRHERATLDYLEYRRELEGVTAELAARRATAADREILKGIIAEMHQAHEAADATREREADVELHNAIGDCAHNVILVHTLRACYRLLSAGILSHRATLFEMPGAREALLAQHEAIVDAILAADPVAARAAAEAHIDYVTAITQEAKRSGEWERVARQRLSNRQNLKPGRKTA